MTGGSDVWITGVGAATPLGHAFETISANLLAGRSGVGLIDAFPVTDHPSRIAGLVGPIPCPAGWEASEFASRRPLDQLVLWCCAGALRDAGWWDNRQSIRVGLVLGLGAEWLVTWENDAHAKERTEIDHPGRARLLPSQIGGDDPPVEPLIDLARRELSVDGPTLTVSAACASGNHALALARRWLTLGWADVCLAGACDMSVTPISLACFGNLRTLSRRNDAPRSASRPFDRDRDGFVIGEGGAMFVLEPAASARSRGAHAYAAIGGFGATSDAYHPVIPSPDPAPAAAAVRRALRDADIAPEDLDYVNAHAPGTPLGDVLEAGALRIVLGDALGRVPVSSTKSMTGHALTAAGAIECLACLTALEFQAIPPTINLDAPDPECADIDHIAHEARPRSVAVVASNSFGFGGSNTCLVLRGV